MNPQANKTIGMDGTFVEVNAAVDHWLLEHRGEESQNKEFKSMKYPLAV